MPPVTTIHLMPPVHIHSLPNAAIPPADMEHFRARVNIINFASSVSCRCKLIDAVMDGADLIATQSTLRSISGPISKFEGTYGQSTDASLFTKQGLKLVKGVGEATAKHVAEEETFFSGDVDYSKPIHQESWTRKVVKEAIARIKEIFLEVTGANCFLTDDAFAVQLAKFTAKISSYVKRAFKDAAPVHNWISFSKSIVETSAEIYKYVLSKFRIPKGLKPGYPEALTQAISACMGNASLASLVDLGTSAGKTFAPGWGHLAGIIVEIGKMIAKFFHYMRISSATKKFQEWGKEQNKFYAIDAQTGRVVRRKLGGDADSHERFSRRFLEHVTRMPFLGALTVAAGQAGGRLNLFEAIEVSPTFKGNSKVRAAEDASTQKIFAQQLDYVNMIKGYAKQYVDGFCVEFSSTNPFAEMQLRGWKAGDDPLDEYELGSRSGHFGATQ